MTGPSKTKLAWGDGEAMHICCLGYVSIFISISNLVLHWDFYLLSSHWGNTSLNPSLYDRRGKISHHYESHSKFFICLKAIKQLPLARAEEKALEQNMGRKGSGPRSLDSFPPCQGLSGRLCRVHPLPPPKYLHLSHHHAMPSCHHLTWPSKKTIISLLANNTWLKSQSLAISDSSFNSPCVISNKSQRKCVTTWDNPRFISARQTHIIQKNIS